MSSHQDWLTARERRDQAAVSITRAIISKSDRDLTKDLAAFTAAEAAMVRIEAELNAAPATTDAGDTDQ